MADNASNEIEQVIKYVLIQTPFKIKGLQENNLLNIV